MKNRSLSAKRLAGKGLDQLTIDLQQITISGTDYRGLASEAAEVPISSHISILPALPPLAGT